MALHNCDEVAVAGFGYNMSTPHAPLHYYEKIRMSAIKEVTSELIWFDTTCIQVLKLMLDRAELFLQFIKLLLLSRHVSHLFLIHSSC